MPLTVRRRLSVDCNAQRYHLQYYNFSRVFRKYVVRGHFETSHTSVLLCIPTNKHDNICSKNAFFNEPIIAISCILRVLYLPWEALHNNIHSVQKK